MTNGDMIQEMFHVVGYTPIYICTGDDEKKEGFRVHIENAFKRDFSLSVSKEWWEGEYKKTATPQPKMGSSSEKPNKWVSLDEKEPKDGQLILVTLVNMYDKRYVQIAEFREEVYRKYDGKIDQRYYGFHSVDDIYFWGDKAVAWMPLPEPYRPEIPTRAERSKE